MAAKKKTAVSPLMTKLSTYIAGAVKKSPPKHVVEKTKHHILDTLAAMVSGAKLKPGRITLSYAKTLGGKPEALVMHLNLSAFVGRTKPEVLDNLVAAAMRVQQKYPGQSHFILVLRSDGEPGLEARKREFRDKAVALGVPVYDEMANAGHPLAALAGYERFKAARA